MKTIVFKNLDDEQLLDIIDPAVPFLLLPNFRPHSAREWWTTDMHLNSTEKLENIEVRDLTADIMTDKKTVERILRNGRITQFSIWQFNKRIPPTLKVDELAKDTADAILIQNGFVSRIWINYEFVELSSVDENYIERMKEKLKAKLA